jgi:branched-subunit amino acid ABC-type transport system permease component
MVALTYASGIILVTQGFVLMYKITRIPNYPIGTFLTLGAYVDYTSTKIIGLPVYLNYPFAFISGALVSLVISLGVIEPMIHRGRSLARARQ